MLKFIIISLFWVNLCFGLTERSLLLNNGEADQISTGFPACRSLLPAALDICITSSTDSTRTYMISDDSCSTSLISSDLSCGLDEGADSVFLYTVNFCDIEHSQIRLSNGRNAPVGIYTNIGREGYRIDLFVDTREFRSTDPNNNDFTESDICQITYFQQFSQQKDINSDLIGKIANSCDEFLSSVSVANYNLGLQCLQSTPFSSTRRTNLLNALELAVQQYAYIDININSGGDDPVTLDLLDEFDRMRRTSYTSDYDFQQDIIDTFILMHDTHTQFTPSDCYFPFSFFQPFIINSRVNFQGDQELYISSVYDMSEFTDITFFDLYGFDPSSYIGYTISEIDGENAFNHFLEHCDAHSTEKDRSARFNNILFGKKFTNRLVRYGTTPSSSSINWHLVHPSTGDDIRFNIEWYVKSQSTFSNSNDFISSCQADGTEQKDTQPPPVFNNNGIISAPFDETFPFLSLQRVDASTAVLIISDFSSPFGSKIAVSSMAVLYLEAIHSLNIDHLLIDVSFNTGGIISSGYGLAAILDPDLIEFDDRNDFDFIHSNILDEAIDFYWNELNSSQRDQILEKTFFEATLSGGREANGDSWYNPGVEYRRGGKKSRYSSRVELAPDFFNDVEDVVQSVINSFEYEQLAPDSTIILTDGSCASTCSFFVRALRESNNLGTKIIGYGGIRGESLRTSQVPANIITLSGFIDNIDQLVNQFQFSSEFMPVPLPISPGSFQFVFREAYNEDDDIGGYYQGPNKPYPVEFTPSPVDKIIQYWPENPAPGAGKEIWLLSIQSFAPPVVYKSDDYDYWYRDDDDNFISSNNDTGSDSSSNSSQLIISFGFILSMIISLF